MAKTSKKVKQAFVENFSRINNLVINGAMDYWQRRISLNLSGTVQNSNFLADRFFYQADIGGVNVDLAKVEENNRNWYKMTCNATLASGSSHLLWLNHKIEGNFMRQAFLDQKSMKLQFRVKSNVVGKQVGYFYYDNGSGTQRIKPFYFNVDQADTEEVKVVDFEWDANHRLDEGSGIEITFVAYAGGSRIGLSGTDWQDYTPTVLVEDDVNIMTTGNYIQITDIMVTEKLDSLPQEFSRAGRDIVEELQLCQRYFEKSYAMEDFPGAETTRGMYYYADSGVQDDKMSRRPIIFKVTKRSQPLVIVYPTNNGGIANNITGDGGNLVGAPSRWISVNGGSVGWIAGQYNIQFHITADAEL